MATTTHKPEEKDEKPAQGDDPLSKTEKDIPGYQAPHGSPTYGITVKGEEKTGKGETRRFQTAIDTHEWLTEDEAKKKGFYWKPADPKPEDAVQSTPKK